jgi:hypothetical protein
MKAGRETNFDMEDYLCDRGWNRLLDTLIDMLLIQIALHFIWDSHIWNLRVGWPTFGELALIFAVLALSMILYTMLFTTIFGITPGMALLGVRIKNSDGSGLTFRQRSTIYWISKRRLRKNPENYAGFSYSRSKSPTRTAVYVLCLLAAFTAIVVIPIVLQ